MVPSTRRHPVRCADGAPSQASVNGTLFIEKGERSQSSNQGTEKKENSRKSDLIDDILAFIGVGSEELDVAPLVVKVLDEAVQAFHRHWKQKFPIFYIRWPL
ncbi:hypothetical protein C1X05_14055 [Laceyella sacchari]|nr:hypothetical protein C1X05_14055 [Laceyella sacchari]